VQESTASLSAAINSSRSAEKKKIAPSQPAPNVNRIATTLFNPLTLTGDWLLSNRELIGTGLNPPERKPKLERRFFSAFLMVLPQFGNHPVGNRDLVGSIELARRSWMFPGYRSAPAVFQTDSCHYRSPSSLVPKSKSTRH
jgi:hypothetical protein